MKKILSLFLSLILILSFLPFVVSAADATGETGDCTWTLSGTTLIISGNGAMDEGMRWDPNITTAIIEKGVTSIGAYSFYGCNKLTSVTLSESVTEISDMAFSECTSLTNIILPEKVVTIGNGVFAGCTSLSKVTFLNKSLTIGHDAFYNCSSLNTVIYNGNETDRAKMSIGHNNESLTNVPWTYSTCSTHVYDNACDKDCNNCGALRETSHTYADDNDTICNVCGDNRRFTVSGMTGDCHWGIYNGVLTVYGQGQMGTSTPWLDADITKIIIEDGVTEISEFAFLNCFFVKEITLPNSLKSIGRGAFYGCRSLEGIVLPEGITEIPSEAFFDCRSLRAIVLKGKVTSIGADAFENSYKIKDVYFAGSERDYILMDIAVGNAPILMLDWEYNYTATSNSIPHKHVYGEWITETDATTEIDGLTYQECACGDRIEKVIPRVLNFRNKTLALQSNISIIFRVDPIYFTKHGYSNPVVTFNFLGVDYPVTEYTVNANGLYEFAFNIVAPHQMKEMVYATFSAEYEGEVYTSAAQEYSIWTYCNNQLTKNSANPAYKKVMALLVDILNYGAAAQNYIAKGQIAPEALANAELTDAQKALGNQEVISYADEKQLKDELVEGAIADIKVAGLTLQDSVVMNFKFELLNGAAKDGLVAVVTAADKTWEIEASEFTYETTSGRWVINFNGLNPAQMREKVSVHLEKDGVIVSDTATYSVESYGLSSAAQGDARLAALVEAMAKYGRSAKAYNG